MVSQGRRICIIVDNFSAHVLTGHYSNIVIKTLEPNCTSLIQALDAGVIASLKLMYRTEMLQKFISHAERGEVNYKISPYDAVVLLNKCWNRVSTSTLINCWHYAGYIENEMQLQYLNPILEPRNKRIRMPRNEDDKLKILRECGSTIYTVGMFRNR
jgi:hypothetical protein